MHSENEADRSRNWSLALPWDWIFLGLAAGMLTLVLYVAVLVP